MQRRGTQENIQAGRLGHSSLSKASTPPYHDESVILGKNSATRYCTAVAQEIVLKEALYCIVVYV